MCKDHVNHRKAVCYAWAEVSHLISCWIVPLLVRQDDWEDYVTFDGFFSSRSDLDKGRSWCSTPNPLSLLSMTPILPQILPPVTKHYVESDVAGGVLCFSSFSNFFEALSGAPSEVGSMVEIRGEDCSKPLSSTSLESVLRRLLPLVAPRGKSCIDLTSLDYASGNVFAHHNDTMLVHKMAGMHDGNNDRSTSLVIILVISASLFFGTTTLLGMLLYVRARAARRRGGPAHEVELTSQQILTDCKRSDMLLGKGGEAEVYFGEISVNGVVRQVASKMYFRPDYAKAEIVFYEALPYHENILRVFGCHIDNETRRWCLAMEYCRHGSMRECMNAGSFPRSAKLAHHTIMKLMGALSMLHQNKMAHRDIKLDNILLSCSCKASAKCDCLRVNHGKLCAKLADFGMSKRGVMMGLSSANVRGTMMYIPPERVNYDIRKHHAGFYALTDIYALGLLIWETLYYIHHGQSTTCKEAIMPGVEENGDVLERIAGGKFVPPCDFLSKEVREFVEMCWHFDPERRFQSIELMMEKWAKMLDPLMLLSCGSDNENSDHSSFLLAIGSEKS